MAMKPMHMLPWLSQIKQRQRQSFLTHLFVISLELAQHLELVQHGEQLVAVVIHGKLNHLWQGWRKGEHKEGNDCD